MARLPATVSLLALLTAGICQPVLSIDFGKMASIKDTIHTAVGDAVKKHCVDNLEKASISSDQCQSVCTEPFVACAGQCYWLQLAAVPYEAAEERCAEFNATLAIPRTRTENLCVAGLSSARRVWLGVTDRVTEGFFVASDGTPLGELNGHHWDVSQPDDYRGADSNGEDCVEMTSQNRFAMWNDQSCLSRRMIICQLI